MLHYEVIHYFVHAIPVIKPLNAYPNVEKEGPTQSKCRYLILQARELRLPYLEALEVLIIAIITEQP